MAPNKKYVEVSNGAAYLRPGLLGTVFSTSTGEQRRRAIIKELDKLKAERAALKEAEAIRAGLAPPAMPQPAAAKAPVTNDKPVHLDVAQADNDVIVVSLKKEGANEAPEKTDKSMAAATDAKPQEASGPKRGEWNAGKELIFVQLKELNLKWDEIADALDETKANVVKKFVELENAKQEKEDKKKQGLEAVGGKAGKGKAADSKPANKDSDEESTDKEGQEWTDADEKRLLKMRDVDNKTWAEVTAEFSRSKKECAQKYGELKKRAAKGKGKATVTFADKDESIPATAAAAGVNASQAAGPSSGPYYYTGSMYEPYLASEAAQKLRETNALVNRYKADGKPMSTVSGQPLQLNELIYAIELENYFEHQKWVDLANVFKASVGKDINPWEAKAKLSAYVIDV